jgi:hypothetical protein
LPVFFDATAQAELASYLGKYFVRFAVARERLTS